MRSSTWKTRHTEFVQITQRLRKGDFHPSTDSYQSLLQNCIARKAVEDGNCIHTHIVECGFSNDMAVESTLVNMYIKCGSFEDAFRVFEQMTTRDAVSWNVMIAGLSEIGRKRDAIDLFWQMQRTGLKGSKITFVNVLKACCECHSLEQGRKIHSLIKNDLTSDVFLESALVGMYVKCGSLEEGCQVFKEMKDRDVVSWNVMIGGYAQNGNVEEAFSLFNKMQKHGSMPDVVTSVSILKACSNSSDLKCGQEVHLYMVKCGHNMDNFFGSCLLDMYAKCGSIHDARAVFDNLKDKDVVIYNVMISGYAQYGLGNEAFKLLNKMEEEQMGADRVTYLSLLKACVGLKALEVGKKVHSHVISSGFGLDVRVANTMIDMYAKCGSMEHACQLFNQMTVKDTVTWTAMISGYAENKQFDEAFRIFWTMQNEAMSQPSEATYVSMLKACAQKGALEQGRQVHDLILESGFRTTISIDSVLIDMYCKCGNVELAREVFDNMALHDVISWTAMIVGYAQHGHGKEALKVAKEMFSKGFKPDHITFMGILSACNHIGLVEDALSYFHSMTHQYGIVPGPEHYACMIDLLGRAGHMDKVDELLKRMPRQPNAMVLTSSLGSCGIHGNMELATHASDCLHNLEPQNTAAFVLLSNIHAKSGDVDNACKITKV